ncbi:MAG: hypothetical protein AB7R55_08330 [Gemmatimonadales bacterium]
MRHAVAICLGLALVSGSARALEAQDPGAPGDWGLVEFYRDKGLTRGAVPAPADTVWSAFREILAELGLEPAESVAPRRLANPRQRAVRRLAKQPLSRYFDCGDNITGPNANTYHVFLRFGLDLAPANGKTAFEFAMYAEAVDVPGGRPDRIACATTGRFELTMVDLLNARFPGTK